MRRLAVCNSATLPALLFSTHKQSQRPGQNATAAKFAELKDQPGFCDQFLINGELPKAGQRFVQPRLARTLSILVRDGLDSYYRGPLSKEIATDLAAVGSLVTGDDLAACHAKRTVPLHLAHSQGDLYNMTPPTQGVVSLTILGLLDRVGLSNKGEV